MMRIIYFIILSALATLAALAMDVTEGEVRAKRDEFALELKAYSQRGVHPAYGLAKILLDNEGDKHADIAYAILTQGVGFGGINPSRIATPEEAALGKATAFLYGVKKSTESQAPIQKALKEEASLLNPFQRALLGHRAIIDHFANLGAHYLPEDPDWDDEEDEVNPISTRKGAPSDPISGVIPSELVDAFTGLKTFYHDETIPSVQAFIEHNVMNATLLYGLDLMPPSLSSLMQGYYFKDMYTAVQAAIKKASHDKRIYLKLADMVEGHCLGGRAGEAILCASVYVLKNRHNFSPSTYENAQRNLKQAHAFFRPLERIGAYVSEFHAFIKEQSPEEKLSIAEELAHLYLNPLQYPVGNADVIYPAYMAIAGLIGGVSINLQGVGDKTSRIISLQTKLFKFLLGTPEKLSTRMIESVLETHLEHLRVQDESLHVKIYDLNKLLKVFSSKTEQ